MTFLGIVLGIAIMAATVYMALNKKSNFHTRLASLGALAVMILTVIICLAVYFSDNKVPVDWSTYIVSNEPVKEEEDSGSIALLIFSIIFFLALFIIIAVLALKEHKKNKPKIGDVIY